MPKKEATKPTGPVSSEQIKAAGFFYDPSHQGYERWTHRTTGVTALRQPYMDENQWNEHKRAKIEEAAALERPIGKLTDRQLLTLRAIADGTLLSAPKRTTASLAHKGLIGPRGDPREGRWLLTTKGWEALDKHE